MAKLRTRDGDATKKSILKTAEKLFSEKGYDGVSIRDISKKCGASGPLIFHHFKNKSGLYQAVRVEIIKRYSEHEKNYLSADDDIKTFLKKMMHLMFAFFRDNPTAIRLMNWEHLTGYNLPWPKAGEHHEMFEKCLRTAQEKGEIRNDIPPESIMFMLRGMVHIWWEYHDHFLMRLGCEENTEAAQQADEMHIQNILKLALNGLMPNNIKQTGEN